MIRFHPTKTMWFWTLGALTLVFAPSAVWWSTAALGATLTAFGFLFGHTVGLHRGVIHRTFRMSTALRGVLLYIFVLTGMGGPLNWMRTHDQRDRWQNQPHSPAYFRYEHGILRDFWWNLHTTYVDAHPNGMRDEDVTDRWLVFLNRTWLLHVLASFALLYGLLGWDHLVISGFARVFIGLLGHWFVGYEAHKRGEQPYPIHGACETGRNRWLLGVLSFGEGFHNNHHAFPESARIGQRPWEFDAGWQAIRGLRALGWVWDVQTDANQVPRGHGIQVHAAHGGD